MKYLAAAASAMCMIWGLTVDTLDQEIAYLFFSLWFLLLTVGLVIIDEIEIKNGTPK
jgi:hypothetical protein